MLKKQNKNNGFSLIELSISLAIIGIIAASALSVAIHNEYSVRKSETEAKLDRIEEALSGFLAINFRLPCPADGTLVSTNANFGDEGTPTSATCPNSNFNDVGSTFAGVVPTRTLQLPDDFMFDGWDRRITYAVDLSFANNDTTNPSCDGDALDVCFIDDAAGSLTINDASGTARTTTAVYVLISHGENGHGAFIQSGSATRLNAFPTGNPYRNDSPDEIENAELDNTGLDTTYDSTFVLKDFVREDNALDANREYFDDIVRFRTKSHVVKEAGAVLFDTICRDASTIINNPGSANCANAYDASACESFATQISLRCLQ